MVASGKTQAFCLKSRDDPLILQFLHMESLTSCAPETTRKPKELAVCPPKITRRHRDFAVSAPELT